MHNLYLLLYNYVQDFPIDVILEVLLDNVFHKDIQNHKITLELSK